MSRDRFPVTIGARKYVVDVEGISWRTVEVTRRGVDQGAGAGESSLSNEQVWRRTRESWHLGAGQKWADLPDDSSEFRYWDSFGIDPFTEKRELRITRNTARRLDTGADSNIKLSVSPTNRLFVLDGADVKSTSDPTVASPSWTTTSPGGGTLLDITFDGDNHLVCDGASVYQITPALVVSTYSTVDTDTLDFCMGRLVCSDGAELFEMSAAGAKTTIFTPTTPFWVWRGAVGSNRYIYAWGDNGYDGIIYGIGIDDASGVLGAPFSALTLPPDERVYSMAFAGAVMVLGTNRGLRLAAIGADGTLTTGPLIPLAKSSSARGVEGLWVKDNDVYFTWSSYSPESLTLPDSLGTAGGIGRLRLDRFTDTLVPAYCHHLLVMNAGVAKGAGRLSSVVMLDIGSGDPRLYFTYWVSSGSSNNGVYGEEATYLDEAHLSTGWFTFSVPEAKQPDYLRLNSELVTAASTAISATLQDSAGSTLATATIADLAREAVAFPSGDNRGERFLVDVELGSVNGVSIPTLVRLTVGATPVPFISDEIVLPLLLADTVADDEGSLEQLDPLDEWVFLIGLRDSQQRVNVTIGGRSYVARVAELAVVNGGLGGGNGLDGWTDKRDWPSGTWLCRLVTMED